MKTLIYTVVAFSMVWSYPLAAGPVNTYDYARVIRVEPVYESTYRNKPGRECRDSSPHHYRHSQHRRGHHSWSHDNYSEHTYSHQNAAPAVVGAIIGGAIGNAIGHNKSNKKVGLAVGAILGGAIGHDISHQQSRHYQHHYHDRHDRHRHYKKRRCSVNYESSNAYRRLKGYSVTYRYKGQRYNTFTQEHPGHKIKVKINVTPVVQGY
jgi:uncharacterized protein YcfJ